MPVSQWHADDHYGLALIAVLGTLIGVLLIQWFAQSSRWAGWVRSLEGVAPPFINIVGVLFALTLAFLANDTWSAHDRAMGAVYREADALRSIVALAEPLPAPLGERVRRAVGDYARVSADEWTELARRAEGAEVGRHADRLLTVLASRDLETAVGATVQALMLRKAAEARADRDQRVALSKTHVNPLKGAGMAFLGFLTLLSVAAVHVDRPRAAMVGVVLFALAAAPTAAIVLVQGNPFQQPTAVTPQPIAAVAASLRVQAAPERCASARAGGPRRRVPAVQTPHPAAGLLWREYINS